MGFSEVINSKSKYECLEFLKVIVAISETIKWNRLLNVRK